MTLELSNQEILGLVDAKQGVVDRRIFSDDEIYQLELERVFARGWNFMAHESMLKRPGDFFHTYIGEDRVIVVRDRKQGIQVMLNTCRHRGNAVCRSDEGHANAFMCTYHGWTYDLEGKLVGVPGFKDYYHDDLKKEEWGLVKAAQVESYKGFIFATFDAEAPPLEEFLGDVGKMGINELVARGLNKVVDGVQKWTIGCNWKFAADNVWDYYHGSLTHASAGMAGWLAGRIAEPRSPQKVVTPNLAVLGEYGHAIGGPAFNPNARNNSNTFDNAWRDAPESKELLGAVGLRAAGHPHIFPNMWIMGGFNQVSLRIPKGPRTTEIWWFTFVKDTDDEATQQESVRRSLRHNGPAGMFEIEDGENWDQSTRGTMGAISKRFPLNYAMNVGRGEVIDDETGPPHIETMGYNEHAQLWYYRAWSEWMAATSWDDLKSIHSPVPSENF